MFGSTVYVHNKIKTTKFESKSWKGILVGYVPNGYKIWNPETNTFVNARDVIFDELSYLITRPGITIPSNGKSDGTQIPETVKSDGTQIRETGKSDGTQIPETGKSDGTQIPDYSKSGGMRIPGKSKPDEIQIPDNRKSDGMKIPDNGKSDGTQIPDNGKSDGMRIPGNSKPDEMRISDNSMSDGIQIPDNGKSDGTQIPDNGKSDGIPGDSESNELIPDESESEELHELKSNKSDKMYKRKRKDSINDNLNYQNKIKRCKLNNEQIEMNSNVRRSNRFKNKPQISYDDSNTIYDHILYTAVSVANDIPKCFQKIKLRADKEKWELAVQDELSSLRANQTWTIVERPKGKNIVDCKWVFAIKADEAGNPIRYKARLVARGFSQQYLVDYNETFAPIARISSFLIMLAFADQHDLLDHHMDVETAFLNAILKEEIYMKVHDGIQCNNNVLVCKLNKSLYGFKQSAR